MRVSVRKLVAFAYPGVDLVPGAGRADMLPGARAHAAFQARLQEGFRAEAALTLDVALHGVALTVTGRMDACRFSPVPEIEELKLCPAGREPPERAHAAHAAQAACYGHMLCVREGCASARLSVVYVDETGLERARFTALRTADELADEFLSLAEPFCAFEAQEAAHRAVRDESLRALPFPYPSFRPGQREMAAQVYTAVTRGKRLFAGMPTGTGKSAAVLFPALKALGEGKTGQVFYLTARTTGRRGALDALARMREAGLCARAVTLTAKEKACGNGLRCSPEECALARGYYTRLPAALSQMRAHTDWGEDALRACAARNGLCPFELSLALAALADVVLCDYNYVFDPAARLALLDERRDVTLLIDEAHHLEERVRESLSGALSTGEVTALRRAVGARHGRKHPAYLALTALKRALEALPEGETPPPGELLAAAQAAGAALSGLYDAQARAALGFGAAAARCERAPGDYAFLTRAQGKARAALLLCLPVAGHIGALTRRLRGAVFFSATMEPLAATRDALGGGEGDALFALPSPFPPENLLVMRQAVSTRFHAREATAREVAEAIAALTAAMPGNYLVFFPSYAYLRLVAGLLHAQDDPAYVVQSAGMDDAAQAAFLARFAAAARPVTGLCVLGGAFSEGVDLPGVKLIGAAVVGVGLPQVNAQGECLRAYYERALGAGFAFAYRYPGMRKVVQAAGRVIRSERDRGAVLLLDDRYFQREYEALLPAHFRPRTARGAQDIFKQAAEFGSTPISVKVW